MKTYTTIQGDTWDAIAAKCYGDGGERNMQLLIEANWPLLDTLVFSAGTEVRVPEIAITAPERLPFWRK